MGQMRIKQFRGATQGSILFLGNNATVTEDYNKLRWDQSTNTMNVDGSVQISTSGNLKITSPDSYYYSFTGSVIGEDRTLIIPELTVGILNLPSDTFVFKESEQTLSNKTLITPVLIGPTVSNPYVTGLATFSRVVIKDAPDNISSAQVKKLAKNSSNEVIEIEPYQRLDFYFTNNSTTTTTATNSWVRVLGTGTLSSLTSNTFTYSGPTVVTLISATGDGGFESSALQGATAAFSANGWTLSNGSQTNKWFIGTTGASGSGYGAYISNNNGASNAYTNNAASAVWFYRDFTVPPYITSCDLNFSLRTTGENTYDVLAVFNYPTSTTPAAGSPDPAVTDSNWGSGTGGKLQQYSVQTGYGNKNLTISLSLSTAPQTRRLAFAWRNDSSIGTNPPASIDKISLTYTSIPEITYTGSQSTFKAILSGSFQATAAISSVGVAIVKNGLTASAISESSFNINTNYKDSFVVQDSFTLSNGDTIFPYIINRVSSTSVLVNDLKLSLIQVD